MAQPNPQPAAKSDQSIWVYLSYILGWLFGLIGLAVVKDDDRVRFHCAQVLVFDLVAFVASMILSFVFIGFFVSIAALIYRIILVVQFSQGKDPRIPVCADFADKNLKNLFK